MHSPPATATEAAFTVLPVQRWQEAEAAHQERVDGLTAGHRARRSTGRKHPVEDCLFEYYRYSPARLRRWHPGPGVALAGAAGMPRAAWRWYRTEGDAVVLDVSGFLADRRETVRFVRELLQATLDRPARLGCFALHEWAMVYRLPPVALRHRGLPLRLGSSGTDAVVEAHPITCSHFDAYRFFTPEALSRNALRPTRETQVEHEQPGCLHAGMDLYKWAFKLAPLVPSDLVLDAFELALRIRTLDMAASPYDVTSLGIEPVPIETPAGKAEFVAQQRAFSQESQALRHRLLDVLDVKFPDLLDGDTSYDELAAPEQAIVRTAWNDRLDVLRERLNLESEFRAGGRDWIDLAPDGRPVERTCSDDSSP